ncbi:MAG: hypothetical protein NDJ90_01725 [Oligoflexia bacterium]|nr:hypothetical protein [Oligoflexia bacterium]
MVMNYFLVDRQDNSEEIYLMKKWILVLTLTLLFLTNLAAAAQGDHLLSYQENYPKSGHWYEFSIDSQCKGYADAISLHDFVSEKKYEGKSVRVIHIYASANNKNCKEKVTESRSRRFKIPIDPKRMTHVYVTYDADISLKSGH